MHLRVCEHGHSTRAAKRDAAALLTAFSTMALTTQTLLPMRAGAVPEQKEPRVRAGTRSCRHRRRIILPARWAAGWLTGRPIASVHVVLFAHQRVFIRPSIEQPLHFVP